MLNQSNPIRDYMTPTPKTIGFDQPLEAASVSMRKLNVRHLPVLKAGKLVGIVSERDVNLLLTFASQDALKLPVEEAMSTDPYITSADRPLSEVAKTMAEKKFGSALVMDGEKVIGIFTAIDALNALSYVLQKKEGCR
jgi:acetoin utilization protein AcuB